MATKTIKNFPEDLWRRMKAHAAMRGVQISSVLISALEEYLDREES